MTKMESEGPYRIRKGFNFGVVGPGIPNTEEQYDLTPDIANMIYAEGRKSMEKDFQELLELADALRGDIDFISTSTMNFDAWKKARGIE